jgi:hypothetical protein
VTHNLSSSQSHGFRSSHRSVAGNQVFGLLGCDTVSVGGSFHMFWSIMVPSSLGSSSPRRMTAWLWQQRHNDPSKCPEPLTQWHTGISWKIWVFNCILLDCPIYWISYTTWWHRLSYYDTNFTTCRNIQKIKSNCQSFSFRMHLLISFQWISFVQTLKKELFKETITEHNPKIIIVCTKVYKQMLYIYSYTIFKVHELGPLTCIKITLVI